MLNRGSRPAGPEIDEAALELLSRHGPQILGTARRYAVTPEDAEDAYQRAFEILLTKAPTTTEAELIPWLKTVVKHEAFALRRQRERHSPVTDDGKLGERAAPHAVTPDQAERLEQLRQGAEALGELKPQEVRALLLKAEGYSYKEICELTGWSYTKVNRALTEGRRAFLRRVAGIQGGAECERFAPTLSALADGEASAEDIALLRRHMRTCLACRARLKEFRAAPARVAGLVPPAALVAAAAGGGGVRGLLESTVQSLLGSGQHKAAVLGERMHSAIELATGQKLAAAAMSAAALAGGGATIEQLAERQPNAPPAAQRVEAEPVSEQTPVEATPVAAPPEAAAEPAPAAAPEPAPPPAPPVPANEFAPGGAAPAASTRAPSTAGELRPTPAGAGARSGGGAGGGSAGGEFAP